MKNKETLEEAVELFFRKKDAKNCTLYKAAKFGAKWKQERSCSEEEVNEMFDTLKTNSIDNVAIINNVDLFISSWKKQFKKKQYDTKSKI